METWERKRWSEANQYASNVFGGEISRALMTVGIVWHKVLFDILLELRGIHETITDQLKPRKG